MAHSEQDIIGIDKNSCNSSNVAKTSWFNKLLELTVRSSRPDVFFKRGVLGNLAKFTGKQLFQSLYLNKVAGLRFA